MPFDHSINVILSWGRCQYNTHFLLIRAWKKPNVHIGERYPLIIGITLDSLYFISGVDWPKIPYYQPPPPPFLDMFRLALKGSFHGSSWSVGEGKESMHIIITIGASDQIVTYLKDVDCRLDSDEPKKLIKCG